MGAEKDKFQPNMDAVALLKADARALSPTPLTLEQEQSFFARRHQLQALLEASTNSKEQERYSIELDRIDSTVIASNIGLMIAIVGKHIKSQDDVPHLVSAALDGANRALEKFRPELGFRFATYAEYWIAQQIFAERKFLDHLIDIPDKQRDEYRRRRRSGEDETQIINSLAEKIGIDLDQLQGVFAKHASLEKVVFEGETDGNSLTDYIRSPSLTPDEMVETYGLSAKMERALAALPAELREILILTKIEGMSLEDVAKIKRLSINTIRRRRDLALHKLRGHYIASKVSD